jgi:hypothetical protein
MTMDDGIDLILFVMGVVMAVAVLLLLLYCLSGSGP